MPSVSIPLLFKELTGGRRHADVAAATVGQVIAELDRLHPGLGERLLENGRLHPTIVFVVDGQLARQGPDTPVEPHSQVAILPTFGGG